MGPRGCVVFTATDPAGPWSDGTTIDGVGGIDPDLAWDDDGTAYVTYSGLVTIGERPGHSTSASSRCSVDLDAGKALEEPRSLWSGTGLKFPEAPHLYRRGDHWYLMIAEGGTERGHGVSIARGPSPEGPFEGDPANPVLSARSTSRPIQNTGHARPRRDARRRHGAGAARHAPARRRRRRSPPLGRETFITAGRLGRRLAAAGPGRAGARATGVEVEDFDFADPASLDDPGWLAVRTPPADGGVDRAPGRLSITGDGRALDDPHPQFVGRRQRHLTATVSATVDAYGGRGRAGRSATTSAPLVLPGGARRRRVDGRDRPRPGGRPRADLDGHRARRRGRAPHGDDAPPPPASPPRRWAATGSGWSPPPAARRSC